jgi:hypothetical protein
MPTTTPLTNPQRRKHFGAGVGLQSNSLVFGGEKERTEMKRAAIYE